MQSNYFSLTIENGQIVPFLEEDPYIMQHQSKRSCLIGYVGGKLNSAVLERMYIEPNERKRGVANEMFNSFLKFCLLKGVERVFTLIVSDDPLDQRRTEFWVQRQGFEKNNDGVYILNLEP